jgi:DNA processing protein
MTALHRLTSALLALKVHRTPSKLRTWLRSVGDPFLDESLARELPAADVAAVANEAADLTAHGIDVALLGAPPYPTRLAGLKSPPPILFFKGNAKLLNAPSIGMCGSRSATERGLRAAMASGEEVARKGLTIVSGYARGVDTETHLAALLSGGSTVIVLAEGILHFRKKRAFAPTGLPEDRVLVVSQFPPGQRWTAGAAMTRNGVITGLSRALVVIEAGEAGGTLNAGLQAIAMQRPVLALEFADGATPPGNEALFRKGALRVRSRQQLSALLDSVQATDMNQPLQLWA